MTDGKAAAHGSEAAMEDEKSTSLNFKVSPKFKKQFKGFAVAQGVSMTALLKEGFILSSKKQKNDRTID
ncbi:hypothetical protein H0A58_12995 [Alcaligenaceae bacterium]|nr:hypothetical protein [Alcaligenaceae bacterium]